MLQHSKLIFLNCQVRICVTGYPDVCVVVFLIPIRHITRCYLITPRLLPSEVFFYLIKPFSKHFIIRRALISEMSKLIACS
jgi:hypothetical protein